MGEAIGEFRVIGRRTPAETGIVRRDDMVAVGQQRHEVAEHMGGGREAVQQEHHRRVGGPGLAVEDVDAVDLRGVKMDRRYRLLFGGIGGPRGGERGREEEARGKGQDGGAGFEEGHSSSPYGPMRQPPGFLEGVSQRLGPAPLGLTKTRPMPAGRDVKSCELALRKIALPLLQGRNRPCEGRGRGPND